MSAEYHKRGHYSPIAYPAGRRVRRGRDLPIAGARSGCRLSLLLTAGAPVRASKQRRGSIRWMDPLNVFADPELSRLLSRRIRKGPRCAQTGPKKGKRWAVSAHGVRNKSKPPTGWRKRRAAAMRTGGRILIGRINLGEIGHHKIVIFTNFLIRTFF